MTPTVHPRRSCPIAEWPQADRDLWDAALTPPDLFGDGPRRFDRLRASTIQRVAYDYGVWLTWLTRQNLLDSSAPPGARADRSVVGAYYAHLREAELADNSIAGMLLNLVRALESMHPEGDWRWIAKAGHRVQAEAIAKPRKSLPAAHEVMALGLELMHSAEEDPWRTDSERAVLFRDGLIIAFLTARPLRLGNLAALEIGRHLIQDRNTFRVVIPAEETKSQREIRMPWPDDLCQPLTTYLDDWRPRLLAGDRHARPPTKALWISRRGGVSTRGSVAQIITSRTQIGLGAPVNPHSFRHIAATDIATAAPDNATDAARVLGHATLATTERYYNRALLLDAATDYQAALGRR